MNEAEMKSWIDNASIHQLLSKWRNAPIGDPFFKGEIGDYYNKVMTERRNANPVAWTAASKSIGW